MNKDRIAGGWKQLKASVRQQWGCRRDNYTDPIESRYGHISKVLDKYNFAETETRNMLSGEPLRHKQKRKLNKIS